MQPGIEGIDVATVRFFRHHFHLAYVMLGLVEIAILILSVYAGAFIRFFDDPSVVQQAIGALPARAAVVAVVVNLCMLAMGLYQPNMRDGFTGVVLRTGVAFVIGAVGLTMVFYIWPGVFLGRGALLLSLSIAFGATLAVRLVFSNYINSNVLRNRVMVLGAGNKANLIAQRLRRKSDQRGFDLVGYLPVSDQDNLVDGRLLANHSQSLLKLARKLGIEEIVVAVDDQRSGMPVDQLLECKLAGVRITDVLTFIEREAQRIDVSLLKPSWLIFSDGCGNRGVRRWSMRVFDVLAASLLLVLTWPLMLAAIIAIKIEDGLRAPVLYSQERVGRNGKTFKVHKFRSMIENAEKGGAQWASKNDMRVTRVGDVLRKYRVDELPQLFNILFGDMAFVGPRPERPVFVEQLSQELPFYGERHRVKPGLTGWAQLNYPYGASVTDSMRKLEYDMYYVKNNSLLLDVMILLQTVEVVLFGRGR